MMAFREELKKNRLMALCNGEKRISVSVGKEIGLSKLKSTVNKWVINSANLVVTSCSYKKMSKWSNNSYNICYGLKILDLPPTETELDDIFKRLVNPTGERRGHIHYVRFTGYIVTKSRLYLFGSEYLNND